MCCPSLVAPLLENPLLKQTINRIADSGTAWLTLFAILFLFSVIVLVEELLWVQKLAFLAGFAGWMIPWEFSSAPGSVTARVEKYFWLVACVGALLIWMLGTQFKSAHTFEATLTWMIASFWMCNPCANCPGFLKRFVAAKTKPTQPVDRQ